jgi:hypothetical protein
MENVINGNTRYYSGKKAIVNKINTALQNKHSIMAMTVLEDIGIFEPYDKNSFSHKAEIWDKKQFYNMLVRNPYIFLDLI